MTEAQWQRQIVELAELYGFLVYHTYDSRRSQPGFPDLVLVRGNRLIFAELKTDKGRVSPAQREWIDRLREAAGTCGARYEVYVWRPKDFDLIHDHLKPAHVAQSRPSVPAAGC